MSRRHWIAGAVAMLTMGATPIVAQAIDPPPVTTAGPPADASIISAARIKRTKQVPPKYPEAARKAGLSGWVELTFTVTKLGTVEDAVVRNASPPGVFDQAAIDAILQWQFEPVMVDGKPVPQRSMLRLRFDRPREPLPPPVVPVGPTSL